MSLVRWSSQSWLYPYSPDRLWWRVGDALASWGDWDERLGMCWLEEKRHHTYLLHVPTYLRELVEEMMVELTDALEQLTYQHQVDVYPVVLEDDLPARVFLCSPCSALDVL